VTSAEHLGTTFTITFPLAETLHEMQHADDAVRLPEPGR